MQKINASVSNNAAITAHILPYILIPYIHPLEGSSESKVSDDDKLGDCGRGHNNLPLKKDAEVVAASWTAVDLKKKNHTEIA